MRPRIEPALTSSLRGTADKTGFGELLGIVVPVLRSTTDMIDRPFATRVAEQILKEAPGITEMGKPMMERAVHVFCKREFSNCSGRRNDTTIVEDLRRYPLCLQKALEIELALTVDRKTRLDTLVQYWETSSWTISPAGVVPEVKKPLNDVIGDLQVLTEFQQEAVTWHILLRKTKKDIPNERLRKEECLARTIEVAKNRLCRHYYQNQPLDQYDPEEIVVFHYPETGQRGRSRSERKLHLTRRQVVDCVEGKKGSLTADHRETLGLLGIRRLTFSQAAAVIGIKSPGISKRFVKIRLALFEIFEDDPEQTEKTTNAVYIKDRTTGKTRAFTTTELELLLCHQKLSGTRGDDIRARYVEGKNPEAIAQERGVTTTVISQSLAGGERALCAVNNGETIKHPDNPGETAVISPILCKRLLPDLPAEELRIIAEARYVRGVKPPEIARRAVKLKLCKPSESMSRMAIRNRMKKVDRHLVELAKSRTVEYAS